jgi:SAM domain (Sterile alpha motif)
MTSFKDKSGDALKLFHQQQPYNFSTPTGKEDRVMAAAFKNNSLMKQVLSIEGVENWNVKNVESWLNALDLKEPTKAVALFTKTEITGEKLCAIDSKFLRTELGTIDTITIMSAINRCFKDETNSLKRKIEKLEQDIEQLKKE